MRNYIVQTVVCVLTGMRHRAWALAALAIAVGAPAAYSQTAQFSYAVETLGGGFAYTARVAVDSSGNVYAAVTGQSAVYKMPSGCTSSSCVTTLGGGFEDPIGIAVDAVGNVYVVDGATWLVKQIPLGCASGNCVTTLGGGFTWPTDVAVDSSGNVYVTDSGNGAAKEMPSGCTSASCVTTLGGGFGFPKWVAVDNGGNVYVTDLAAGMVDEMPPGCTSAACVTPLGSGLTLYALAGVAVDNSGNAYVTDYYGVQEIPSGCMSQSCVTTLGGGFSSPLGVAVDSKGNVYVGDFGNQAVKEVMTKSVALSGTGVGQSSTSPSLTFTFGTGGQIAAPVVLTEAATGLDLSDAGRGSCTTNGPSYTYTPGSTCTVQLNFSPRVAGLRRGVVELTTTSGVVIATAYVYGTGIGPQVVFNPGVLSTLGGGFSYPDGVAVDGSGNVYVADSSNKAITEMPAGCMSASCVTTLGGGFSNPRAIALDGGGNIYFADGNVVKEMPPGCMSASCVTTVSGNFGNPQSLAVDGSGNLYFCQTAFNVVNEMPAGCASLSCATVLGGGFEQPTAVAVDGSGNVYVGDGVNSALYRIPPGCTSSSCVTTLNGAIVIDTIAVDGSGDVYLTSGGTVYEIPAGCPSASCMTPLASVPEYSWIAVDGDGNIYVSSGFTKLVQKMDRVDPPTLTFAPTAVGSTNSSPQTVTLANIGNAPLTFPAPASGQDPSVSSSNFLFGNSSTCPILSSSSNPGTLASGSNCTFMMDFAPAAPGSLNGSLLVTDSNLNATSATQSIPLSGTGIQITLNPPAGSLPTATSGQLYNQVFLAGGGTAPYTYTSTALALGLTLSSTGVLSGTPTSTGSYAFSVTATDSSEFTVTQNYTLTVNGSFKLIATPSSETVPRGILAAFLLEVESLNGFSGSIAITCAGGPSSSVCGSFPETLKLQPNKVAIALSGVLFPKNTPPG